MPLPLSIPLMPGPVQEACWNKEGNWYLHKNMQRMTSDQPRGARIPCGYVLRIVGLMFKCQRLRRVTSYS